MGEVEERRGEERRGEERRGEERRGEEETHLPGSTQSASACQVTFLKTQYL